MRTPTSRDDLGYRKFLAPDPVGCMECGLVNKWKCSIFGWYGDECYHNKHFERIRKEFEKRGLTNLDTGSYRTTYLSKNGQWVYKIPLNADGYRDNYFEACAWKDRAYFRRDSGTPIGNRIARCRMLPNGVLVMEYISSARRWYGLAAILPLDPTLNGDPATYAIVGIDSCQGGLDRQGVFKIYDYTHWVEIANPIPDSMMAL